MFLRQVVADEKQVEDTIIVEKIDSLGFNGKIFDFSLTRDPKFCNPDSLIEGDCNSGFLYFTPKGKVIYNYICLDTTDAFCIGKAVKTAKGFDVTFDQYFSYTFSENDNSPTVGEINSGKLEKIEPFTLHLKKMACKAYAFTGGDVNDPEYYVVTELKNQHREDRLHKDFLLRNYKRAKVLSEF